MRTDHLSLEHLSRYLSNKLSVREQDEVQEHLQQCPQCRKKLKEMRALHSGFFAEEKKEELHKKRFSRFNATSQKNGRITIFTFLTIIC